MVARPHGEWITLYNMHLFYLSPERDYDAQRPMTPTVPKESTCKNSALSVTYSVAFSCGAQVVHTWVSDSALPDLSCLTRERCLRVDSVKSLLGYWPETGIKCHRFKVLVRMFDGDRIGQDFKGSWITTSRDRTVCILMLSWIPHSWPRVKVKEGQTLSPQCYQQFPKAPTG